MDRKDVEPRLDEKAQSDPVPPADGPLDDSQLDAVAGGRGNNAVASTQARHDKLASDIAGSRG